MSYTDEEIEQFVEEVATNYADLLILQYRACPKARATIKMFVEELLCNGFIFQFENILDIDTAFDYILNLIGKLVGCPRYIPGMGNLATEDYRQLLKFKILVNVLRASQKEMDDPLYALFGDDIVLRNNQNLTITYIISSSLFNALTAALKLRYFRAPCGVEFEYVLVVPKPTKLFAFRRVNGYKTPVGFSLVNAPKEGTFLTVNNIENINDSATAQQEI